MFKAASFFTLLLLCCGAAAELSQTGTLIDRIVAVVNEGVVLESELEEQLRNVRRGLAAQNIPLPPEDVLRAQVLESLVLKRIQLQRAERLELNISDEELNRSLAAIAQRNGFSFNELPTALALQGIDYPSYREEARTEMIIEQLRMRDVGSRISITRGEVDQMLAQRQDNAQEYEVYHLLISVDADADEETVAAAEAKAQDLYRRLQQGEQFGVLAVAHSDVPGVLTNSGSLGYRKADELPSLFADKVVGMSVGDSAEPIRSSSGFHLIMLNDVRGAERVITNQRLARHILVQPDEIMTEDSARTKIEDIAKRLAAGEDFAALAEAESDDAGSARRGGDLGWTTKGSFVGEFEAMLDRLSPGETSEPFRSSFGWHIVQLLDTREHDSTQDMQRNQAAQMLRARKFEEETQNWLRQLRDEAYVEIRLDSNS